MKQTKIVRRKSHLKKWRENFCILWLKQQLLRYLEETDGRVFNRMLKRHQNKGLKNVTDFFEFSVSESEDFSNQILFFYSTEYEKNFYKWVYVSRKITKPLVSTPPSPRAESPPTPSKKAKPKPVAKSKKGKPKKSNDKDDLKSSEENLSETANNPVSEESEKIKRKKSLDNKPRAESPPTVVEMGPQAECQEIIQKVKTLVKKRKIVNQFHCHKGPISKKVEVKNGTVLLICRKSMKKIPFFDTFAEAVAQLPKYIIVGNINIPEYITCFNKHTKVLIKHMESSLTEPEFATDENIQKCAIKSKKLSSFKNGDIFYDVFFMSAANFYACYQKLSRQLYTECGNLYETDIIDLSSRLMRKEAVTKRYSIKTIISFPLYLLKEDLAEIFYNIRQKSELKEIGQINDDTDMSIESPIKTHLKAHLHGLIKRMNWWLNHVESDIDLEVEPWPGIEDLLSLPVEELRAKRDLLSAMEKRLESWEKYVKNLLQKCRSKGQKGSGPVAEYHYWFKREDQIGPLVLTLYGKNVSNILAVLKKVESPQAGIFEERRLHLKKYYDICRENRDYISACIHCLEAINTANEMEEVKRIIPELWERLRYLWLLSGYWSVKSNIVGFIERVQYLIVKKSIKVLEVNHFFMVPQVIGKQLALEVIETMETWKKSFHEVKAFIERHEWEMRWEFPLHRIFTVSDYMAKLANDFSYLSHSLKQYLDVFSPAFSKIVQDESVIETFSERVKALTTPIRTADFNIYDPDNDVHWNLLIESFARDLNTIEKESLQIINESFQNLRSSVYATNFLLSLKEVDSQDKLCVLLKKKFEFINIQLIKEIKLINDFIMNHILVPPILNYQALHSGRIYWIRHLSATLQFKYIYLSNLDEIKRTRTLQRAEQSFMYFMKFYELYQLTEFINWINVKKDNIQSQLSGRIFKLKCVKSHFTKESYIHLIKRPSPIKIKRTKRQNIRAAEKKRSDEIQNMAVNKVYKIRDGEENGKTLISQNPIISHSTPEFTNNKSLNETNDEFSEIKRTLKEQRRAFLFLLHQEKSMIDRYNKAEYENNIILEPNDDIGSQDGLRQNGNGEEAQRKSSVQDDVCKADESQSKAGENLLIKIPEIEDIFIKQLSSQYPTSMRDEDIVDQASILMERILNCYSKLKYPPIVSDLTEFSSPNHYLEPNSTAVLDQINEEDDKDDQKMCDYSLHNEKSLFEILDSIPPKDDSSDESYIDKDNYMPHKIIVNGRSINIIRVLDTQHIQNIQSQEDQINIVEIISSLRNEFENNDSPSQTSLEGKCSQIENESPITDTSQKQDMEKANKRKSDLLWHEYISDYILIEIGQMIELNFDVRLFDTILEIYHMTKLGYRLPSQFYGLCLLHRTIFKDLQTLKKIIDKYNRSLLNFTPETLLTFKTYIYQFEYLLRKGLNYYSWHTTNVEHFQIQLYEKLKQIESLDKARMNILLYIDRHIEQITNIQWFNFSGLKNGDFLNVKQEFIQEIVKLYSGSDLCIAEESAEPKHPTAKELFEELEALRDKEFKELLNSFNSISLLMIKLEHLVLNSHKGKNKNMVLYYKYYEQQIFNALVVNFSQNIKELKTFIVGKSAMKIHFKLINREVIKFDFNAEQCRYFFIRTIEKLLLRYKSIPRWKVGTCESAPLFKRDVQGNPYSYNYLDDIIKLKHIALELIDIRQVIDTVVHNITIFQKRWEKFRILQEFDKEITIDNFFKNTSNVTEKCDTIFCYCDQFITEVKLCKSHSDLYCVRIDLREALNVIMKQALDWKSALKCKLTEQTRTGLVKIYQSLKEIQRALVNRVKCLEDFQCVLQGMKDFSELRGDYDVLVSFISKVQYILARHGLRYSSDDIKMQKDIQSMYSVIRKLSKYKKFIIKPSFEVYRNISETRIRSFTVQCTLFAEGYYKSGPGSVGDQLDKGLQLLQDYREGFNELNEKRKKMIQAENLFNLSPHSYQLFDEACQEFHLLQIAYDIYEKQKEAQMEWAQIPWIYLNSEELTSGIESLLREFEELPAAVRALPVARQVWSCMNNFKQSIPLMVQLKNESLKQRHWEELMANTGHHFEMLASKFTLNDMFCMKLYLHKELVNDIIGKSVMELSIERRIISLKQYWTSHGLQFNSRKKKIILGDNTSTLKLIEDYCINLQKMADSQFSYPFLEDITFWEKRLAHVGEIISGMSKLQDNLIRLENIFSERILHKRLAKAYKQYEAVDREFYKILKIIQYRANVLEQSLVPGQHESIMTFLNRIEECKHLLSNYLNSKRNEFPRYYLLQDDEVFSALSSRGTDHFQNVLQKVFYNIKQVVISLQPNAYEVKGLVSNEDEILMFKTPQELQEPLSSGLHFIHEEMKCSNKYMTKMAIYSYATVNQTRIEWIYSHLGSCILAAIKVWWTLEVEDTLKQMKKGEMKAMKEYINKLDMQLSELFLEVVKSLTRLDRIKIQIIILQELHGREVTNKLSNNSIISVEDFEWESQLRHYWRKEEDSLMVRQCLEEFEYGYEYMGIGRRLVTTPLTDRIYLGISQALGQHLWPAAVGPPSSGKTETIKDLSLILGVFCVHFNCSSSMTNETFYKCLSGMCQDGLWACFDEFNLISEPVLSVIWKLIEEIRYALIKNCSQFKLEGRDVALKRRAGLFVTMKGGFSEQALPEATRQLFRPIACVSPDVEQICQAILYSEGFLQAKSLSKKMVRLYELAREELSKEGRYDFSLRALKSLLLLVGDVKRHAPDMEESIVLMRLLRDLNRSKFLPGDESTFNSLIADMFPGVTCPPIVHPELENAVIKLWQEMDCIYCAEQVSKVSELWETVEGRRSGLVVGPSGGGKTFILDTLLQALAPSHAVTAVRISPKAMPVSQLYGHFQPTTMEWIDGLFPKLFREMNSNLETNTLNFIICDGDMDPTWTENINSIMDENKQLTLANCERIFMSENFRLLFETGNIDNVSPGTISKTAVVYVNPGENDYNFFWQRWKRTRIDEEEVILFDKLFEKYVPGTLGLIFGELSENGRQAPLKTVITLTKLNMVMQLCFMIDGLLPIVERGIESNGERGECRDGASAGDAVSDATGVDCRESASARDVPRDSASARDAPRDSASTGDAVNDGMKGECRDSASPRNACSDAPQGAVQAVECIFIHALYSSLGAVLSRDSWPIFDSWIKEISNFNSTDDSSSQQATFGLLPTRYDTLFDYCADLDAGCWVPWSDLVEDYIHESSKHFDEIIVPTKDSCKYIWIMNVINKLNSTEPTYNSKFCINFVCMFGRGNEQYKYKMKVKKKRKRPFLLVGETCSSKTTIMKEFASRLDPKKFIDWRIGFSFGTEAGDIQAEIERFLTETTHYSMLPRDGKKLVLCIDDLNRPIADEYGTQQSTAFLKLFIENNGLFRGEHNLNWYNINDVYLFATMTTSKRSVEKVDPRFVSLFSVFSCSFAEDGIIQHIYSSILRGHLAPFGQSVSQLASSIVTPTIQILKFVAENLMPTPEKFHYIFNLRDIGRITEGLLQTSPLFYKKTGQFVRVWRNEVTRVLCDRLLSRQDKSLLEEEIKARINEYFQESAEYVLRDPLLFGDYRNAMQPPFSRDYEDLLDFEAVYHLFTEIIAEIKKTNRKLDLVLFEEVLEHLTRIHRTLRLYRGHALILGPTGSGKQTLVNLASYTAGCNTMTIKLKKSYNQAEFLEDIKYLFKTTGLNNVKTTFVLKAHHIIHESFLDVINTILTTGSFYSIFSEGEKNTLIEEYSTKNENNENIGLDDGGEWERLEKRSRQNLHIALLMSQLDAVLRRRCIRCPGIIDYTVADSIQPWPSQALYAIAQRHLKDAENIGKVERDAIVDVVVYAQNTSGGEEDWAPTPSHFLHLINLYITFLNRNLEENISKCQQLEKAIMKVKEGQEDLEEMKERIQLQKSAVDEKKNICVHLQDEIVRVSEALEGKRKDLTERVEELEDVRIELKQQVDEIQEVLSRALEDIDRAQDSIRDLDIEQITNISGEESPSDLTAGVFESVLILLGVEAAGWEESRRLLADPLLLHNLEAINLNSISIHQQKQIRARLKRVMKMRGSEEVAAREEAFLLLLEAILNYCTAFRETKPKQERVAQLEKTHTMTQNSLNNLNMDIENSEKNINELNEKFQTAISERDYEERQLKVSEEKLEAAEKLVIALQEDHTKWEGDLATLAKRRPKIIGNTLAAALFLTYAGPLSWPARRSLLSRWLEKITIKAIPISKPFRLEDELVDDIQLSRWKMYSLPENEWSIQNCILLHNSARYPLCIDPKDVAASWLLKYEAENEILTLTLDDAGLEDRLRLCLKLRRPILLKDIEYMDPSLLDIFEEENTAPITDGEEPEVVSQEESRGRAPLYLTAKSSKAKHDPLIFSLTTVINFEIVPQELEESLHGIITQNEQEENWRKGEETRKSIFMNKSQIFNLNILIISKVGDAEQSLLGSTQHIEELYGIKQEIYQKLADLEENYIFLKKLEVEKSIYQSIAKCGTVLYFVVCNLETIHSLYQYSLKSYMWVFKSALKTYPQHPISEGSIEEFKHYLKEKVCIYACQGMFSRHKILMPLLMAMELEKSDGNLSQKEINYFVSPSVDSHQQSPPPVNWMTNSGWTNLQILARDFPSNFGCIIETLTENATEWEKWCHSQRSEKSELPAYFRHMKPFQKLMLLKCICTDHLPRAIIAYIQQILGEEFINLPFQEPREPEGGWRARTPLLLLHEPGLDGRQCVIRLSNQVVNNLHVLALSSPEKEEELKPLVKLIESGECVLIYNWENKASFCEYIQQILQSQFHFHPSFRLWLIAEVNSSIPASILQCALRVVKDTPDPLKFKLRGLYEEMDDNLLQSNPHPAFKPILYILSFFHSVLQERKKFGKTGWNMIYDFGLKEFTISIETLKKHLTNAINLNWDFIPWKYLRFLIGEVIYGGYILDAYDRRLILTYLEEYFDESLFTANESFAILTDIDRRYSILPEGSREDMFAEIDKMTLLNSVEILGLHLNHEIKFYTDLAEQIRKDVARFQRYPESKEMLKKEDLVKDKAEQILSEIPALFEVNKIKLNHEGKKTLGPSLSALVHELRSFNRLICLVTNNLRDLISAIKGEIKMEDEIECLFDELYHNKIPAKWESHSPLSSKSLCTWFKNFNDRKLQYEKWSIQGQLTVIWLGGLHFPRSYLLSFLQVASRKKGWPLENLTIKTEITQIGGRECYQEPPELGCYISGVHLQGANWDPKKNHLVPLVHKTLYTPLPVLWLVPTENFSVKHKEQLRIPVYATALRNHELEGPVFETEISTSTYKNKWILEGICMLLNID